MKTKEKLISDDNVQFHLVATLSQGFLSAYSLNLTMNSFLEKRLSTVSRADKLDAIAEITVTWQDARASVTQVSSSSYGSFLQDTIKGIYSLVREQYDPFVYWKIRRNSLITEFYPTEIGSVMLVPREFRFTLWYQHISAFELLSQGLPV